MLQKLADQIFSLASKAFKLQPREKTPDWAILTAVGIILAAGTLFFYLNPWILGVAILLFMVGGFFSLF